jgi:hypothetical protein
MSKFDITIAGEINLDLNLYGLPEQTPTERKSLPSSFAITLGSSSAILAHNLAALGSRVGFVTKVGDDSFGTLAVERLRERVVGLASIAHGAKSGVTLIPPHGPQRHIGASSTTDCGGTEAFRDIARMQEFFRRHNANNQAQQILGSAQKSGLTHKLFPYLNQYTFGTPKPSPTAEEFSRRPSPLPWLP